jgi:hypothetical protein
VVGDLIFLIRSGLRRAAPLASVGRTIYARNYATGFSRDKPHMNIGTIGHVDHGKTSLTAAITRGKSNLACQWCWSLVCNLRFGCWFSCVDFELLFNGSVFVFGMILVCAGGRMAITELFRDQGHGSMKL